MKKCLFFFILSACFSSLIFAQTKYEPVDEAVRKLGALLNYNVATVADTVTADFSDKEQKARAIFYWIANNIAIDPKAVKQHDDKNTLPEKVMESRKTTALGFSLLVQEMCSRANIRCLSVDGYIKYSSADINESADEKNHSWNVIQLGQSPETWYYADAYSASGSLDKKMTLFTKNFTGEYFFADRQLFNLAYFPDNNAWQLGPGPKSLKDFYALPVFGSTAFYLGVRKAAPATGYVKTKMDMPLTFSFNTIGEKKVTDISLLIGDEKKQLKSEPMDFKDNGTDIKFSYKFKKEGTFPVKIMGDGKELLQYIIEVTE